jgi:hypothetical protein
MTVRIRITRGLTLVSLAAAFALAGCGGIRGLMKGDGQQADVRSPADRAVYGEEKLSDLFSGADNPNVTVGVNKYIWNAALDVLSFMPVEAADPFSGVIVMGWGSPGGTGRTYRATVYIQDPALDARSLRVALVTRGGPASKDTIRQIEDAILTRARQMRIADSKY